jgi:hypothetical protein
VIVCVDFDGTIVVQDGRRYDDVESPLEFVPGAKRALLALKAAGHALVLWSARASLALRHDPAADPLVRAGVRDVNHAAWRASRALNEARYQQMLAFVDAHLPRVFDAIDDGTMGKPLCDLFIDDKAIAFGQHRRGLSWLDIQTRFGADAPGRRIA